jgi:hypothetical protein
MASDELDLKVYGIVVDSMEKLSTREQKIAALRCYCRGLQGLPVIASDYAMLEGHPPIEIPEELMRGGL